VQPPSVEAASTGEAGRGAAGSAASAADAACSSLVQWEVSWSNTSTGESEESYDRTLHWSLSIHLGALQVAGTPAHHLVHFALADSEELEHHIITTQVREERADRLAAVLQCWGVLHGNEHQQAILLQSCISMLNQLAGFEPSAFNNVLEELTLDYAPALPARWAKKAVARHE